MEKLIVIALMMYILTVKKSWTEMRLTMCIIYTGSDNICKHYEMHYSALWI